ncbi:ABC transporter ATP-binding protein [Ureibacillus manganicus]|uniref:Peptide ABC transporter substrate-binding protein n=1 Tax=Ureibacillus manganicus DSM 26584 TaxID=1384049 RepID=A0A0A3IV66_9BACL|nr:dipeptide ABC transporter ATP-binding protein [Ureibacillus manganicus]KGR78722.1 peptide ABC transporter substrate-binding protein [Ureibacillus manganicus DSM 26584]
MPSKERKQSIETERDVLLEVTDLKKYFILDSGWFNRKKEYLKAVDGVSFHLEKGETLGIVGESGCGKSTTGNLIMNILEPTEGSILFNGKNLSKISKEELREERQHIQMIFQDPYSSLNPRLKVFDIIAEPLISHNLFKGEELKEKVQELIETVGLRKDQLNRYPHEFSGGQRQRIGIARALALNPKLIICDEPVSALDVSVQSQILNLLARLQKEYNLTYIFIAHGLPAVKHVSDRIAVMYLGKIVEIATKEQIFSRPLHPYTEGLLAAIPIPDPTLRKRGNRNVLEGDLPSAVNPPSGCSFHTRCQYATQLCKNETPKLLEFEKGHSVSCHYPIVNSKGILVKESVVN